MTVQSKTEIEQTAKSEGPYQNDKELSTPSKAIKELEKYQEYHLIRTLRHFMTWQEIRTP